MKLVNWSEWTGDDVAKNILWNQKDAKYEKIIGFENYKKFIRAWKLKQKGKYMKCYLNLKILSDKTLRWCLLDALIHKFKYDKALII